MTHLRQALALDSNNVETQNDLGFALLQLGRADESLPYLHRALEIEPNRAAVHYNLANALLRTGRMNEAAVEFQKAIDIDPTNAPAYSGLGYALLRTARASESLANLQTALEIDPDYADAHSNLANTLLQLGRTEEAMAHLQRALALNPDDAEAQKNMAWVRATSPDSRVRNGTEAVALAERADRAAGGRNPIMGVTLAAAYAEAGRFPEAIRAAEKALQLANDSKAVPLAEAIRAQLVLYHSGQPFRDNR
jgi:tetratricopeptide (TPR) repeat protein